VYNLKPRTLSREPGKLHSIVRIGPSSPPPHPKKNKGEKHMQIKQTNDTLLLITVAPYCNSLT